MVQLLFTMDSASLTTSIRALLNVSSGNYTTSPVENFIKTPAPFDAGQTDILILQYLGNVTSSDQILVVVPEYLWPFLAIIP